METFTQIICAPVWDGNLCSKTERDRLFEAGLIARESGFNFLSNEGVRIAVVLGLLHGNGLGRPYITDPMGS